MGKATIKVRTGKRGKLVGRILFEDGKEMSVPPYYRLNEALNNKPCQVVRTGGRITKIIVDGKELSPLSEREHTKKQARGNHGRRSRGQWGRSNRRGQAQSRRDARQGSRGSAKAPYNFVPLNDVVVKAEFQNQDQFPSFITYNHPTERYTGYIDLTFETLTPLYIKGMGETLAEDEEDTEKESAHFFSPGGIIKIPGSSVRGMVRTLVEIVSWSKFQLFEDKQLYYRGIADSSSLGVEYRKNMPAHDEGKKRPHYRLNAGYLQKKGHRYYIIPAQEDAGGKQFTPVKREKGKAYKEFEYEKRNDGKWLVHSGNIRGKGNDWLINPPDDGADKIEIPSQDIESYKRDENRFEDKSRENDQNKKDGNLIRLLKVKKQPVPCFYVRWKDDHGRERVSFGHTRYFRLAYKKTIGDHVPAGIRGNAPIDLTEALFGTPAFSPYDDASLRFASRVFFEDAACMPGQGNVLMPKVSHHILSSPKPTTFQHYLEQPQGVHTDKKDLKHWNSDGTNIRGHKLYWHKDVPDEEWIESEIKYDRHHIVIQPVRPHVKFSGRIRFEHLSQVELGALLFVLDLPEEHCHKLGMDKPLGLGTVRITPSLFISDRPKRYTQLFSEDGEGWHLAEEQADLVPFKEAFEKYMIGQLREQGYEGISSLWSTPRLTNLKTMLDWKHTKKPGWHNKVEYMRIQPNQFRERPVLPNPEEVVNEE